MWCASWEGTLCTPAKILIFAKQRNGGPLKEEQDLLQLPQVWQFPETMPVHTEYQEYQKPHNTWLHLDSEASSQEQKKDSSSSTNTLGNIASHTSQLGDNCCQILLMAYQVQLTAYDGSTILARALLDSVSSTSVITEHLVQCILLPWQHHLMQISSNGAHCHTNSFTQFGPLWSVSFILWGQSHSCRNSGPSQGNHWLTINFCDLKHLLKLQLADPNFSTPGNIDLILGANVFSHAVCYGQRYRLPGSPSVFKTSFGWVLAGNVSTKRMEQQVTTYCASVLTGDDLLRKF